MLEFSRGLRLDRCRTMESRGQRRRRCGIRMVSYVWYRAGGSLVASMASVAPRRRRRDAIGDSRGALRGGAPDGRRPAAPRQGLINYGSFTRLVYSAATSRVKIHCVWW